MSKITYNINKSTTGLVAVIQGHYLLLYPFTQFKKDAKHFSYFKGSDMIEVHFGLFGVVFGKATVYSPFSNDWIKIKFIKK